MITGVKAMGLETCVTLGMLKAEQAVALKDVYIFPTIEGLVEPAAVQSVRETPNGLVVGLSIWWKKLASDGKNANHLAYVLRSRDEDPLGPYTVHGPLATGDGETGTSPNIWAIDMTVLEHGGIRYAIWSGWDPLGKDPDQIRRERTAHDHAHTCAPAAARVRRSARPGCRR